VAVPPPNGKHAAVPPPTRVIAEAWFLPYMNDLKRKMRHTTMGDELELKKVDFKLGFQVWSKESSIGGRNRVVFIRSVSDLHAFSYLFVCLHS